jgi:UDP-N-acetylmuramoyl-L-alanyl-D-glutamate--2,6-diaminopimelate ligase
LPSHPRPKRMPEQTRPLSLLVERWRQEGRLLDGPAVGDRVELAGIRDDSRAAERGDLFVAVRGLRVDGHDFVDQAIERGAAAVAVERPIEPAPSVPQLVVDGGAAALASAAAWWYGDPSRELLTVGITGTNGKTTTSFIARAALEVAGLGTGLIGTIGIGIGDALRRNEEPNTTPGALALQALLREMRDVGEDSVVIETSSHGLAAERVGSVDYDAAIFTNLSHEHLDFHGTFEAYRGAKLSLFTRLHREAKGGRPGLAVINADDASAQLFAGAAASTGARVVTYGAAETAGVQLLDIDADARGSRLAVEVGGSPPMGVTVPIPGRYNAHNALAVLALAWGWDLDLETVAGAIAAFPGVRGRMESIDRGQPFGVVVDYAHTPKSIDAVAGELAALAKPAGGSVISVFGASGERDVGKRPLMGEAAARHSRLVIVTEDDSRAEDPESIYEAIARGAEEGGKRRDEDLLIIGDRREAIAEAFRRAKPGDVVLLAGKGHETWNMGPNGPEPWSDRETAEQLLAKG